MKSVESDNAAIAVVRCKDMSIDIYAGADGETLKSIFGAIKSC